MTTTVLEDDATYSGIKSACQACGEPTRATGDMLCASCWPKVSREAKAAYREAWNGARFEGLSQGVLDAATARLVAEARGVVVDVPAPPVSTPRKEKSRECSQCKQSFTFVPGHGRPPLRCRECRGLARYDIVPAKPVRLVVHEEVERVGIPELPRVWPANYGPFREQLLGEIAALERGVELRRRAIAALDDCFSEVTP